MKLVYHPEVEDFIRSLPQPDESRVAKVVDLFKDYKFNLTQVHLKKLVKGLWELRVGKYRLLFGIVKGDAVMVSIFAKKTQKTPKKLINLAVNRLKEYEKQT